MEFIEVTVSGKKMYIKKIRVSEVHEFVNTSCSGHTHNTRIDLEGGSGWNVQETVTEIMELLK